MINKYIALPAALIYSLIPSSSVEAATFGSALFTSQRSCSQVSATDLCDGRGPGQGVISSFFGGGSGTNGFLNIDFSGGSSALGSFVTFTDSNLPAIAVSVRSADNDRISLTALGFQTFTYTGNIAARYSLTGQFSVFDASTNPVDGALPGGGFYTQFLSVVSPDFFDTDGDVFDLFNDLRSGFCGNNGVFGSGFTPGTLTGGGQVETNGLTACSSGSLILSPGQQFIVIAGLQIPVNRGGFAEGGFLGIRLGDDLSVAERLNFERNLVPGLISAVPEPASWAMMLVGFGLIGGGLRSRSTLRKRQIVLT
jgi:PEP-CTERM motif